jgi:vitamin B12 transporter
MTSLPSHRRPRALAVSLVLAALALARLLAATPNVRVDPERAADSAQSPIDITQLSALVVTASGVREAVAEVPQTIHFYDERALRLEVPRSVVDFVSENAVGFSAPISPGHSFLSLRGAITNQIGYDDSSEVAVLVNGRRSGTVNLSKLSPIDAFRVEVLRGPSSVIYGSSAIGGVVNLITKNGLNSPGTQVTAIAGSWQRYTGGLESGGKVGRFDYYLGAQYQTSADYKTGHNSPGDGVLINTSYRRRGGNLTLGYALGADSRAELIVRSDGLYDVGHRGVTYSYTDHDDRYNQSVEFKVDGLAANGRLTWLSHTFYARDVETWYWSQEPLLAPFSSPTLGNSPGIARDDNTRKNNILGEKLTTTFAFSEDNTLLAGVDLEYTRLQNHRVREASPGYVPDWRPNPAQPTVRTPAVDLAPLHYNYVSRVFAPYLEDTQKLLNDRLTLKAGARFDLRWQALRHTIYESPGLDYGTHHSDAITYRVGSSYKANDWLTLKASAGTGFRAPNPNELNGDNVTGNGLKILGNPNLKNEESLGWEIGAAVYKGPFTADATYFSSDIRNRITSFVSPAATAANGLTTSIAANLAHARTAGVEFKLSYDVAKALGLEGYRITPFVGGVYHFKYEIEDPVYQSLNNDLHIVRVNKYQGTAGLRVEFRQKWESSLSAIVAGPTFEGGNGHGLINANYPTNPTTGQPITTWIFQKEAYTLFNARFSYQLSPQVRLFGGVNNLTNLNYDPSFLALNEVNARYTVNVYKSQSRQSTGSSAPGREFFGGVQYSF